MRTDAPKRYDVPLTAVLPFVVIPAAFFLAFGVAAAIASLGAVGYGLWSQRSSRLHLTPDGAFVNTLIGDRAVAWRDVTGVRQARPWSGGIVFETQSQRVRCPAPTSWWGGPATPEQVAEVERWWLEHRGAGPEATI